MPRAVGASANATYRTMSRRTYRASCSEGCKPGHHEGYPDPVGAWYATASLISLQRAAFVLRVKRVLRSSPSPGPISMSAPPHYPLLTKNTPRRVLPACGVPDLSDRSGRERGYNAPRVRCAAPKKEVGNGVSVAKLARASGGALPPLRCAQPAYRDRDAAGASVRRLGRLWHRLAGDEHGRGRRAPGAAGRGSEAE
jgi:hypothetical protein